MATKSKAGNGEAGKRLRARDVSAPEKHVTIGGRTYTLVFSNAAIRTAEDVYVEQYGKDVGFAVILKEMAAAKYCAIMAMLYGALIAGGCALTWADFDRDFRVDSIEGMRQTIMQGMVDSMPTTGGKPDPH
jgi:hypothetical protein